MAPIKSCCGNAKQLQHFHASKDMTCLGPDTGDLTEISQTVSNSPGFWCHAICLHDRRRLEDQLVLKGVRMFCTVRSAYVFFFPTSYNCMSEFVLAWSSEVLKYCSIGWFASNCQWPQGWSLKQWFFARKQHGLPPNPNIPEQLGSFWVPSCPVPIWCTLHT